MEKHHAVGLIKLGNAYYTRKTSAGRRMFQLIQIHLNNYLADITDLELLRELQAIAGKNHRTRAMINKRISQLMSSIQQPGSSELH